MFADSTNLTRRSFLAASAAAAASMTIQTPTHAQSASPPVCVFSKHLQWIKDWGELADTYAELGCDAADLTVRDRGHIEPQDAAVELPKCVKAFRGRGLDVAMITTYLENAEDSRARPSLEAAAGEGIRFFRCGTARYPKDVPVLEALQAYQNEFNALSELAASINIEGGYHNHSGPDYIGAAMWDLHQLITNQPGDAIGSNFDLGHTLVEGSFGAWEVNARLIAPHVKMIAAKDFVWTDATRPKWVPLGEGRVPMAGMLRIMKNAGFAGPISIHFEYDMGSRKESLAGMKASVTTLRQAMKEAGFNA